MHAVGVTGVPPRTGRSAWVLGSRQQADHFDGRKSISSTKLRCEAARTSDVRDVHSRPFAERDRVHGAPHDRIARRILSAVSHAGCFGARLRLRTGFDHAEHRRESRSGQVVGIDFGESQIQRASESAKELGIDNATFQQADCYSLPFEDESFDRVFSNALMEHLTDPVRAMREMFRVLKPGGMIGVSSPDWGGFILAPPSDALTAAVAAYTALQTRNGGDVNIGRKLGSQLSAAGFEGCQMSARYEIYPSLTLIGELPRLATRPRRRRRLGSNLPQTGADNLAACLLNAGFRASPGNARSI